MRPHTGLPEPLEHVAAYALAGGLLTFGFGKRSHPFITLMFLSLYAAILEIAQIWVPGRNPQFIDLFASSAGALIGSALAWIGLRVGRLTKKSGLLSAKTEAAQYNRRRSDGRQR